MLPLGGETSEVRTLYFSVSYTFPDSIQPGLWYCNPGEPGCVHSCPKQDRPGEQPYQALCAETRSCPMLIHTNDPRCQDPRWPGYCLGSSCAYGDEWPYYGGSDRIQQPDLQQGYIDHSSSTLNFLNQASYQTIQNFSFQAQTLRVPVRIAGEARIVCPGLSGPASDLEAIKSVVESEFPNYRDQFHFLHINQPGQYCAASAWATGIPSDTLILNGWLGHNFRGDQLGRLAHEVGHTLGGYHSNTWLCPPGIIKPFGTSPGCQHVEYGDNSSIMGSSTGPEFIGLPLPYVALNKGWLNPDQVATVQLPQTRAVRISSIESQDSPYPRALDIKDTLGFVQYELTFRSPGPGPFRPRDDWKGLRIGLPGSLSLDMDPQGDSLAQALPRGSTFADPGVGVKIWYFGQDPSGNPWIRTQPINNVPAAVQILSPPDGAWVPEVPVFQVQYEENELYVCPAGSICADPTAESRQERVPVNGKLKLNLCQGSDCLASLLETTEVSTTGNQTASMSFQRAFAPYESFTVFAEALDRFGWGNRTQEQFYRIDPKPLLERITPQNPMRFTIGQTVRVEFNHSDRPDDVITVTTCLSRLRNCNIQVLPGTKKTITLSGSGRSYLEFVVPPEALGTSPNLVLTARDQLGQSYYEYNPVEILSCEQACLENSCPIETRPFCLRDTLYCLKRCKRIGMELPLQTGLSEAD